MTMKRKAYQELTFTDDFLFCNILQTNPDICKALVELILGRKVAQIKMPESQKSIDITTDSKGVRFDVYFEDEVGVTYDIEMQTNNGDDIPKRSRYYQGVSDIYQLRSGAFYNQLNKSYVIFINLFDLFGKGLPIYTFENICLEDTELKLNDGAYKIFVNATSERKDVAPELQSFLDYLLGELPTSPFTDRIQMEVDKSRRNQNWEVSYMTLEEKYQEKFNEGFTEGKAKGIAEAQRNLIATMHQNGASVEDIAKLTGISVSKVQIILQSENAEE